jgi:hypothetical protein
MVERLIFILIVVVGIEQGFMLLDYQLPLLLPLLVESPQLAMVVLL